MEEERAWLKLDRRHQVYFFIISLSHSSEDWSVQFNLLANYFFMIKTLATTILCGTVLLSCSTAAAKLKRRSRHPKLFANAVQPYGRSLKRYHLR